MILIDMMRKAKIAKRESDVAKREFEKNMEWVERDNTKKIYALEWRNQYKREAQVLKRKKDIEIREKLRTGLMADFEKARENLRSRITKSPTEEMIRALNLLRMDESVSISEMKAYAEQMADCPQALKILQQIAKKNDLKVNIPVLDSDAAEGKINMLEGHFAYYVVNLGQDGSDDLFGMKQINSYLLDDTELSERGTTQEQAARAFWNELIRDGSPELMEADVSEPIKVQYYFSSTDRLINYIEDQVKGLSGKDRADKCREILDDCPESYAKAYSTFLSTGRKIELTEESASKLK